MPDYLNPAPLPVDPDTYSQDAFDRIRSFFADFDPQESQLASVIISILSLRAAEIADLTPLVPKAVFRWFGANVIGLPPEDGSPASASVTFTVRDNLGYTVPADTAFVIENDDGDQVLFTTDADAPVAVGQTSVSGVSATSQEDGSDLNGITNGTVTLVDALDYVINVTHQGTTSGGTDPEEDDDYLDRLSLRLGLEPRPVRAEDFATHLLVEFPEIRRAVAIDNYAPGNNQIDLLNFGGTITGGTYTIGVDGPFAGVQNTAPITWLDADQSATIQAAIEALASVEPGDVSVTLIPATSPRDYLLEYKGRLAATAVSTSTSHSLTGTAPTFSAAASQPSSAPNAALAANVTVAGIDASGNTLSASLKAQADAFLQANREWGFTVSVVDVAFNLIDATFTFTTFTQYSAADVKARAEQAIRDYLDPLVFGAPPGDSRAWNNQTKVYLWEIVSVLNQVEGLDRLVTLTLGVNGGAQSAADVTMTGTVPMPKAGAIAGTAV